MSIETWTRALNAALAAGDPEAVAALFLPDGFWRDFFGYIGTSIVLSTSRHQRTDGQTERTAVHTTLVPG